MKASATTAYGGTEVLKHQDLPDPSPGDDEVRIKVVASSLNPIDTVRRTGEVKMIYPIKPFPGVLGVDATGVIESVGSGVSGFAAGDRVIASADPKQGGCHAELLVLPASQVAKLPEGASFVDYAVLPCAALTSLQVLRDKAGIKSGQKVLINGASGGVGSHAIQIAKSMGAHVTAVASGKNEGYCRSLGADGFIDYKTTDFTTTDQHFDLVFDAAAKLSYGKCKKVMTKTGTYVTTLPGPGAFVAKLLTKMSSRTAEFIIMDPSANDLKKLIEMVKSGTLKPQVTAEVGLEQIAEGYKTLEGGTKGKIAVRVAPDPA